LNDGCHGGGEDHLLIVPMDKANGQGFLPLVLLMDFLWAPPSRCKKVTSANGSQMHMPACTFHNVLESLPTSLVEGLRGF
ncbi:MAG: hypothetical protein ACO20E_06085, partial [Methylophilaceae bacterium]